MEYQEIKKIIKDMENCKLECLEITFPDGTKVAMKKSLGENEEQPAQKCKEKPCTETKKEEPKEECKIVKSPMVGTFYASPSPKEAPYVKKGDKVRKGDVLCLVEAMKLMNEIESEFDGEIVEVCVANEEMVDFGTPLFKIK